MKKRICLAASYYKMPPLNLFEDYDACMDIYEGSAKYCFVQTILKPDESSQNYQYIKEFSSSRKQHFRHDKLSRGICINVCEKMLKDLGISADELYEPKFEIDFRVSESTQKLEINKLH